MLSSTFSRTGGAGSCLLGMPSVLLDASITQHAPVGILDDYERAGIRSNASPRARAPPSYVLVGTI